MKYRDMTVDVPDSMRRLLFEGCEMPETNEKDIRSNTGFDEDLLDEGLKNKLLGWFGAKSNWTIVEDLLDMLSDRKSGTPEYRKLKQELGDALMKACCNSNIKNAIRNESRPSDEDLERYVAQIVKQNTNFKVTEKTDKFRF